MLDSILADRDLVILQLKFATMFIVSRILAGGSLLSSEWMVEVIYLLLGLATYSLIIKKFVPKNITNNNLKTLIEVNAMYGSMLIVSKLLSGNEFTSEWINSIIYILLGFTTYNIIIKDIIPYDKIKDNKIKNSLKENIEIFTMSLVSQFLSGKIYDLKWFYSTFYTVCGFITYHMLTSSILN